MRLSYRSATVRATSIEGQASKPWLSHNPCRDADPSAPKAPDPKPQAAAPLTRFRSPDPVSTRYERLAANLGINATIHRLRRYSATELVRSGVDVRTAAAVAVAVAVDVRNGCRAIERAPPRWYDRGGSGVAVVHELA